MESLKLDLDTSRETSRASIYTLIGTSQLPGEDDTISDRITREFAPEHNRVLETPLGILCRVAATNDSAESTAEVTVTMRDEIMRHSSGAFSQYVRGSSITQNALALSRINVKHPDSFTKELITFPAQPNSVLDKTDEVASSQISTPLAEDEGTDESASSQTRTLIAEDEDAGGRGCEGNSISLKRSCDELASDLSTQDGGSDGSLNTDAYRSKRRKFRDASATDLQWLLSLGVAKANEILEGVKNIELRVREFRNLIDQVVIDDLNSLSWAARSAWRSDRVSLYTDSLCNLKCILEDVKGGMKLEGGEETQEWENFLSLE